MTREFGRLLTAMVTPFDEKSGAVDLDQAKRLASALLDSGTEGLVVCGTTGESPTLSNHEKLALLEATTEVDPPERPWGDRRPDRLGMGLHRPLAGREHHERRHPAAVHQFRADRARDVSFRAAGTKLCQPVLKGGQRSLRGPLQYLDLSRLFDRLRELELVVDRHNLDAGHFGLKCRHRCG